MMPTVHARGVPGRTLVGMNTGTPQGMRSMQGTRAGVGMYWAAPGFSYRS